MQTKKTKTILLVEDDPITALAQARTISAMGHCVLTVHSGEEAVKKIKNDAAVDLILMDIDLGQGITGPEAANQILEIRSIPIVFLTSHAEREMVDMVRNITRYGYVIKNSGDFVLQSSIEMAFELFEANIKSQSNEHLYHSLFNNMKNGFAYCKMHYENELPVDFTYLVVNDAFSDQTGLVDVTGKRVRDVIPGVYESTPELFENFGRVALSGVPEQFEIYLEPLSTWLSFNAYSPKKEFFIALFEVTTERKKLRLELEEKENRLRFAFEGTNDGLWDVDLKSGRGYLSPRGCRILGYEQSELRDVIDIWSQMVHPDDLPDTNSHLQSYLEGREELFAVEQRLRTKSGEWKWILTRGKLVSRDKDGNPERMTGTHTDIDDRKRAEEMLKSRERDFSNLVENAADMITRFDTQLRHIFCNPAVERELGIARSEFLGKTPMDASGQDEAKQFIVDSLNSVLETGKEKIVEQFFPTKNGMKYFQTRIVPEYNDNGQIISLLAITRDITALKYTENLLIESEYKFRNLFQNSGTEIIVINKDGIYQLANNKAAEALGSTPEQITGKSLFDFFPEDIAQSYLAQNQTVIESGMQKVYEASFPRNNIEKTFLIIDQPVKDSEGRYYALQSSWIDISDRIRIENKLAESEQHFRNIVQNSSAGYFFIDTEGIIREVNDAWVKMYRYDSADQVIGRHFAVVQMIEDLEAARELVAGIMRNDSSYLRGEFSRQCRDGSIGYHSFSAQPVIRSGAVTGIEGFIIDTTEQKKAEEKLRESEKQYHSLFNSMQEGFALHEIICDQNGRPVDYRFIDMNPAFENLTGLIKENIIGRRVLEVMPGTEISWIERYGEVALTGKSMSFDNYSSVLSKHYKVVAFSPGKGQFAVLFNDVTDQKNIEIQLRESEQRFRDVIELAADGILTGDKNGIIIEVNRQMEMMTGRTHDDLIGKHISDIFEKEILERSPLRFDLLDQGLTVTNERSIRRTDGTIVIVEMHSRKMPDGSYQSIYRDISARKQMEETLAQEQYLLNSLIDNVPDLIYFKDRESRFIRMNNSMARIFGLNSPSESVGKTDADFFTEEFAKEAITDEQKVLKNNQALINKEEKAAFLDSKTIWYSATKIPLSDRNGKIFGIMGISRDITDIKNAQEQTKTLLTEKEILLKEVHHRIKNNMSAMIGLLTLQAEIQNDPVVTATLKDASNRLRSMGMLYDKLYRSPNLRELSLNKYLEPLVSEIIESMPSGVTIKTEVSIDDFSIGANLLPIIGIIANELITNIIKYAFPGRKNGIIKVSAARDNQHITIIIADNGIGMDTTYDMKRSSGFGLKLVSILTEQISGTITIERKKGTRFVLEFDL